MGFRPLLRPEVAVDRAPDGSATVDDPAQGLWLALEPGLAALLEHLDGRLEAPQVAAVAGVDPDEAEVLLKALALAGLLLGVDEAGRAARVEARAAGPAGAARRPFQLLLETRFVCGRCGVCCRTESFGPLTREEMARLRDSGLVRGDPELAARDLFVRRPADGEVAGESWSLERREDGACVFLSASGTCRVAEALGPEARPVVCRLFPLEVVPDPAGLVVADSTRCATFSASSAAGAPLHEAFDDVRPVLRAAARREPVRPGLVRLPGGLLAPGDLVREAVARALEAADALEPDATAGAALEVVRNALDRFAAAIDAEPLGPELPGRVRSAFTGQALAVHRRPLRPPDPVALASALRTCLERALPEPLDLARDAGERLRAAAGALRGEEAAAAWPSELEPALRRALRQRLHGRPWPHGSSVPRELVREVLTCALTTAGARRRAAEAGRAAATGADLDAAQRDALAALAAPAAEAGLAAVPAATLAVFLHATELGAWLDGSRPWRPAPEEVS